MSSVAPSKFWNLKPDAFPETGFCKPTNSVPKLRPSGDSSVDQDRGYMRSDLVYVLDKLLRYPEHIKTVKGHLESRPTRNDKFSDEELCFKDASTLGKVASNDKWVAGWLVENSKLTTVQLEKVKSYDPDGLKSMLYWAVGAQPGLQLPEDCVSKQIMTLVLNQRAANLGKRLEEVAVNNGISADGAIDWNVIGPHEVKMAEGKLDSVTYRGNGAKAELPSNIQVTTDFVVEAAHSEFKARFVYGLNRIYLHELFPAETGPHAKTYKPLTGKSSDFNKIVSTTVLAQAEREKAASQGLKRDAALDNFGSERKKARSEAAAKKAREALNARNADMATKRTVRL